MHLDTITGYLKGDILRPSTIKQEFVELLVENKIFHTTMVKNVLIMHGVTLPTRSNVI